MIKILNDIELKQGEVFGFVGLVDSGKTTMMTKIYKENSKIANYIYKLPIFNFKVKTVLKCNYNHEYVKRIDIDINKRIHQLNYTETKKLLFLLSIFTKKEVVILDDQFLLLDSETKKTMVKIIKELEKTIIISLNDFSEAQNICNRFAIIKDFKVVKIVSDKKTQVLYVTIEAKNIDKSRLPLKDMIIKNFNHDDVEFIYKGNVNDLLDYLVDIDIKNLQIREINLEEMYKYNLKKS